MLKNLKFFGREVCKARGGGGGGAGDSHMEGMGMLVGNFKLNP